MHVNMVYWQFYYRESTSDLGSLRYTTDYDAIPPECRISAESKKVKVPMDIAMRKDFDLLDFIKVRP